MHKSKECKKKVRIIGGQEPIIAGTPALLFLPDGRVTVTSPVVSYSASSNSRHLYVETENTIYATEKKGAVC